MSLNRLLPVSHTPLIVVAILLLATSLSAAEWKEKVLYSFQGGTMDGSVPAGAVVFDQQGNLYGATTAGGPESCTPIGYECGVVFQLSPPAQKGGAWTETPIYQFQGEGSKDGSVPTGGLIFDAAGNLYGVTAYGGKGDCLLLGIKGGCGTVYELSRPHQKGGAWTETILYSFQGGNDGYFPWGNLVFDAQGNIYGATQFGGGKGTTCNSIYGGQCGTVFKLSPPKQKGGAWKEKVLYRFKGGLAGRQFGDGANPNGGLLLAGKGGIFGTTFYGGNESGECNGGSGGSGCGTVFELTSPIKKGGEWKEEILFRFNGQDGATPVAGVIFDKNGNIYGAAYAGASAGNGAIFELARGTGKSSGWRETVLHRFDGGTGGGGPVGGLTFDLQGALYGTASFGSTNAGSVFEMKPANGKQWAFTVLYGFAGVPDGAFPAATLVLDKGGNLYSTTTYGGDGTNCRPYGCGTVFELKP
jgi:hypothetical protein